MGAVRSQAQKAPSSESLPRALNAWCHAMQESAGKDVVVQSLGLQDADENREIDVFSCSLVSGVGYSEGFRWLSARL